MIAPVVSVTAPSIEASPCARAMRGAAAKITNNRGTMCRTLAAAFPIPLLVFLRGMNFVSLKFSGVAVVLFRKKWA